MELPDFKNIRIDAIKNLYQPFGVSLDVLRLDLLHPHISGNKWFKLQNYLKAAQNENKTGIITFGGAFSNHIVATAAACHKAGLQSIGIIRGEEPKELSHTLLQSKAFGMELYFISRKDYQKKMIPVTLQAKFHFDNLLIINEGGYGIQGCNGAAEILNYCGKGNYSHLITAVGTGTTLAGLVCNKSVEQHAIGISALKNAYSLQDEINMLLPYHLQNKFELIYDFHFGGYAKFKPELIEFMNWFYQQTAIPTDFVYTGKMFFALHQLVINGHFSKNSRILAVHTGGLQGNASLPKDTLIFR